MLLTLAIAAVIAASSPVPDAVLLARAFPSLSEPDPLVVYQNYQDALESASDFEAFERLLSARKRAYIAQRTTGADPKERATMLRALRDQFLVRSSRLRQDDVGESRAILVFEGQIVLPDRRIVKATVGVVLIKEDGEWRVDHQRVSYRERMVTGADPGAEAPEQRVEF